MGLENRDKVTCLKSPALTEYSCPWAEIGVPKTQTEMNYNPERGSWHDELSMIIEIGLTETKSFVAVVSDNLAKQKK